MEKIGIYGGSFDPIHIGHLIMADNFYYQFELDKLLFIPSFQTPLKTIKKSINFNKIIEMLKIAISYNSNFLVEEYEINKKATSYTYDTINFLKEKYSNNLYLLIGDDQFFQFKNWKNWKSILENTTLVVAERNVIHTEELLIEIEKYRKNGYNVSNLDAPKIEISSTNIRNAIKNKFPYRNFLPAEVYSYILKNKLYQ